MSHKFKKLKEDWDESFTEAQRVLMFETTFKDWLVVTFVTNLILIVACAVLYVFFRNDITMLLIQIGLSISVFFILITAHEFGHAGIAHLFGCKYSFSQKAYFNVPLIHKPYQSVMVEVEWPSGFSKKKKYVVGVTPNIVLIIVSCFFIFLDSFFFQLLGTITLLGSIVALVLDVRAVV